MSTSLQRFRYLDGVSEEQVEKYLLKAVSLFMPEIRELEIQPGTVMGYAGMPPSQVLELAGLKELTYLSVPLSMAECISNLPEVIYVLKEFRSLRFLVLSWGTQDTALESHSSRISFMT